MDSQDAQTRAFPAQIRLVVYVAGLAIVAFALSLAVERATMLLTTASARPKVTVPPIDALTQAQTETATFAMG